MKKYKPSITGIEGDLAFSNKQVWLYVELPSLPYEFLDFNSREALAESLNIGMESILVSQEKAAECMLIITSVPFDDKDWADELARVSSRNRVSESWFGTIDEMQEYVQAQNFRSREVFLGILIGDRAEYKSTSTLASLRDVSNALTGFFGVKDLEISETELDFWKKKATGYKNNLMGGALRAQEVRAETIARLLKETLWPGIPIGKVSQIDRQSWGSGEIAGLAIADIQNNSKYLKISQFDNGEHFEGYKATLCFSRFPDEIDFPSREPWIHYSSLLSHPATLYSRFTIEPARKVAKVVGQKEKDALDQFHNSGGHNAPLAIIEQLQVAQQLKFSLNRERKPWLFGRHRIVVTAKTKAQLDKNVQEVIDHYKNLDIDVVWPSGDQLSLLLESQPADRVRSTAYYQRQELGIISVGMPSGSGKVGDVVKIDKETGKTKGWLGPYIGRTTSRVEEPVFFSIHSAIAKNHPPGCVITGAPGGGKTFTGLSIAYTMALQDVWTVIIDPKGDAVPMAELPSLKGRVKVFDLKNGSDGLLDPFTLVQDPAQQKLLAIEVVKLFKGGRLDPKEDNALMEAVGAVALTANPSLYEVVNFLRNHRTEEGKALGNSLDIIRELPFSKLCFSPSRNADTQVMRAEDGLTIISLKGLKLPGDSNRENYNTENFLAVGIMYLLTNYTESLMYSSDEKHPKAVIIDEAWAITSTPQGASMIPRLARMGRSLNTALILISQNAEDFLNMTNSMPYRLSFKTKDQDEIKAVSKFLGLESHPDGTPLKGNAKTIENLEMGECLMRDPDGRIARVQIDNWNQMVYEAIDTNPESKKDRRSFSDVVDSNPDTKMDYRDA